MITQQMLDGFVSHIPCDDRRRKLAKDELEDFLINFCARDGATVYDIFDFDQSSCVDDAYVKVNKEAETFFSVSLIVPYPREPRGYVVEVRFSSDWGELSAAAPRLYGEIIEHISSPIGDECKFVDGKCSLSLTWGYSLASAMAWLYKRDMLPPYRGAYQELFSLLKYNHGRAAEDLRERWLQAADDAEDVAKEWMIRMAEDVKPFHEFLKGE